MKVSEHEGLSETKTSSPWAPHHSACIFKDFLLLEKAQITFKVGQKVLIHVSIRVSIHVSIHALICVSIRVSIPMSIHV